MEPDIAADPTEELYSFASSLYSPAQPTPTGYESPGLQRTPTESVASEGDDLEFYKFAQQQYEPKETESLRLAKNPYKPKASPEDPNYLQKLVEEFKTPTVARAIDILQADQNLQSGVGPVQTAFSSLLRGTVKSVTDAPKFLSLLLEPLTGSKALEEFAIGIDQNVNEALPIGKEYSDSFWLRQIPEGLGQVLGMVGTSLATGGIGALSKGLLSTAGTAFKLENIAFKGMAASEGAMAVGNAAKAGELAIKAEDAYSKANKLKELFTSFSTYLMGGSEGYDAYTRSIEQGDSILTATAKSLGYATVAAAIEADMTADIVKRVHGMLGGKATGDVIKEAGNAVLSAGWKDFLTKDIANEVWKGFKEEGIQSLAQSAIVGKGFVPSLSDVYEAAKSASAEGAAGGVIQGLIGGITGIRTPFRPRQDLPNLAPLTNRVDQQVQAQQQEDSLNAIVEQVKVNATETPGEPEKKPPTKPTGETTKTGATTPPTGAAETTAQEAAKPPDYSGVSQTAADILRAVDGGGIPMSVSAGLEKAAIQNGITEWQTKTPAEIVAELRAINTANIAAKSTQTADITAENTVMGVGATPTGTAAEAEPAGTQTPSAPKNVIPFTKVGRVGKAPTPLTPTKQPAGPLVPKKPAISPTPTTAPKQEVAPTVSVGAEETTETKTPEPSGTQIPEPVLPAPKPSTPFTKVGRVGKPPTPLTPPKKPAGPFVPKKPGIRTGATTLPRPQMAPEAAPLPDYEVAATKFEETIANPEYSDVDLEALLPLLQEAELLSDYDIDEINIMSSEDPEAVLPYVSRIVRDQLKLKRKQADTLRSEEEDRKAKEAADLKAEEERKAKEEEERKAKEAAALKAEEERKAREEAERKAKEDAQKAQDEAAAATGTKALLDRQRALIESLKTADAANRLPIVQEIVALDQQLLAAGIQGTMVTVNYPDPEVSEEEFLALSPKWKLLAVTSKDGKVSYTEVTEEEFNNASPEAQQLSREKTFTDAQNRFIDRMVDENGFPITSQTITENVKGSKVQNKGVSAEYKRRLQEKYPQEVVKAPSYVQRDKTTGEATVVFVTSSSQTTTRKAIADIVGEAEATRLLREANSPASTPTETIRTRLLFTNNPDTVLDQFDRGVKVVIPNSIMDADKLHPNILYSFNSDTKQYEVAGVRHPVYGLINSPGQFKELDAARAAEASESVRKQNYTLEQEKQSFLEELSKLSSKKLTVEEQQLESKAIKDIADLINSSYTESQPLLEGDDWARVQSAAVAEASYLVRSGKAKKLNVKKIVDDIVKPIYSFRKIRTGRKATTKEGAEPVDIEGDAGLDVGDEDGNDELSDELTTDENSVLEEADKVSGNQGRLKGWRGEISKELWSQLDTDQQEFLKNYSPDEATAADTKRFTQLVSAFAEMATAARENAKQDLLNDPAIRNKLLLEGISRKQAEQLNVDQINAILERQRIQALARIPEVIEALDRREIDMIDLERMKLSRLEAILAEEGITLPVSAAKELPLNARMKSAVRSGVAAVADMAAQKVLRKDANDVSELRLVEETGALTPKEERARRVFTDGESVSEALSKLAQTSKDPRLKTLAQLFEARGLQTTLRIVDNLTNPDTGERVWGYYDVTSDTVYLDTYRQYETQSVQEETLIHEVIHAFTLGATVRYSEYTQAQLAVRTFQSEGGTLQQLQTSPATTGLSEEAIKTLLDAYDITLNTPKEIIEFGREINRLYNKTKAYLRYTPEGRSVYERFAAKSREHQFYIDYGLTNVDEFCAALAHRPFRELLNNIPDTSGKSLWRKVCDAILGLLQKMFNIETGSVLDNTLTSLISFDSNVSKWATEQYSKKSRIVKGLGIAASKKLTTSLEDLRKAVPEIDKALTGKIYHSEMTDENVANANAFIFSFNSLDEAFFALDLPSTRLTERERLMTRTILGIRLTKVAKALAPTDKALSEYYDQLAGEAANKVSEELTRFAKGLNAGLWISQIFSPNQQASKLTAPTTAAQVEVLKDDANVTAIEGTVEQAKAEAIQEVLAKNQGIPKKVVKGTVNPELQGVFDFFNEVQDTTKLDENLIKKIAERLVKLANPSIDKAPLSERKALEKEVMREVMSQLSSLVTAKKAKKPAELRDILLDNVYLTKRAFENAVSTLVQFGRLSPDKAQAVKDAKFVDFDYKAAREILLKQIKLTEELRKTFTQRKSTLANVTQTLLENSDLSEADAKKVAEALEKVFNTEVKKKADALLRRLSADKSFAQGRVSKVPADNKFLQLFELGVFDERELYNRIALANPNLKLPTWNPLVVEQIKKEAEMIEEMPEGDAKREKLINLNSLIAEEHAKNLKGLSKFKYWIGDLAPAIWQAGVLSGLPTQTVNFLSAHANVGLQGLFQAMGYQIKALGAGVSLWDSFKFYGNLASGWTTVMNFFDKSCSGKLMVQKAWATGSSRFKNMDATTKSILEQDSWASKYLPHKYVGRIMTGADGVNCQIGVEIAMRHALTYAFMTQGKQGRELANAMAEAFDPNVTVKANIEARINDAAAKGFLGQGPALERNKGLMRLELMEEYRQEMSANSKLIASSMETAKDWTFNNDPRGIMGLVFDGISSQLNKSVKVTKFVLPFMRTMANLVNNALDFSLFGLLRAHNMSPGFLLLGEKNKYRLSQVERGSVEYNTLMAQGVVGTAGMLYLLAMAIKGVDDEEKKKKPFFAVYGPGPKDFQKAKQLEQGSDWRKNSIRIGDQVLRYTDWPVMSLALGAIGAVCDMRRYEKNLSEKTIAQQAQMFGLGVLNLIFEKNLISGLSNIMDIIKNPDARGAMALEKFFSGIVGGFTNPQALKWSRTTIEGLLDENGRSPVYDRSTSQGYWMSMVPASGWGNQPMLNTLGQPITQPWHQGMTGRFISKDSEKNPIFASLVDQNLFITSPSKSTEIQIAKQKIKVGSSDQLWREFVIARGEQLQKRITPAFISSLSNLSEEKAQERLNIMTEVCRDAAVNKIRKKIINKEITL